MNAFLHALSKKVYQSSSILVLHPQTRARFKRIVVALLDWHEENQRSFIWRDLRRSPYVVLVSEYMLQQTGAKQVEKRLPEFLKQFPSVKALAKATRPEVLRAWYGLGYNRRALNLHAAAKALATKKQFPKTVRELRALPGIGQYTASAILSFAYNEDTPVVDVNIERVLSRLWKKMPDVNAKLPMKAIDQLDAEILPKGRSSAWHEALMDHGSTICTKKAPKCDVCPVNKLCPSRGVGNRIIKNTSSSEKLYFGQPRRIWRGRILQTVSQRDIITAKALAQILISEYDIDDRSFSEFVTDILSVLEREGFVTHTKNGYSLAHG